MQKLCTPKKPPTPKTKCRIIILTLFGVPTKNAYGKANENPNPISGGPLQKHIHHTVPFPLILKEMKNLKNLSCHYCVFTTVPVLPVKVFLPLSKFPLVLISLCFREVLVNLSSSLSSLRNSPYHKGLTAATIPGGKYPFQAC